MSGLLALYAPDARIGSIVARGKVNKEAYAGAMKQARAQGYLGSNQGAKILSLNLPSATKAVMEFDYSLDVPRRGHRTYMERFTWEKRAEKWQIVETEYLKK